MTPTVGRSVHYFPVAGGTPLHAVITRVFSPTCVNLDVAVTNSDYPNTNAHPTSVALRDDPSQAVVWDWPERVESPVERPAAPEDEGAAPKDGDDENTPAGV